MIPVILSSLITPYTNAVVYLSGGIDSSIILHHVKQKCPSVVAYTAQFGVSNDETNKARRVADYLGVKHVVVNITKDEFLTELPYIMKIFDRPRFNIWPYFLAKKVSNNFLNTPDVYIGEGSDEIFGYPDRGYLEGWAGQLVYVRPTYDIIHRFWDLPLKAPFTELHHYLISNFSNTQSAPLAYYQPPNKICLRRAYKHILPDWIVNTPTTPPAFTNYKEFGLSKRELQLAATRAWLEVHDV